MIPARSAGELGSTESILANGLTFSSTYEMIRNTYGSFFYSLNLIDKHIIQLITSAKETDPEAWSLGTDCADCECKLCNPASILRVIAFKSFPKQISLFLPSLTL